jgi:NTP pyrophosphatase (non-canonical NTP hydrolase)
MEVHPNQPNPAEALVYSPDAYDEAVSYFAFYAEMDPKERNDFLKYRLNEETEELLGSTEEETRINREILLGREHDVLNEQNMIGELGDCMYYLTALSLERGISFGELVTSAYSRFGGDKVNSASVKQLDALMAERMKSTVPDDYNPSYFMWQMYSIEPTRSENGDEGRFMDENLHQGGLLIIGDGYYSLWFVMTYVSNFTFLSKDSFKKAAVNAVGVISGIANNRLNSSLELVLEKNMMKLHRRKTEGTLQGGADPDRDKKPETERPQYTTWSNTTVLLLSQEPEKKHTQA